MNKRELNMNGQDLILGFTILIGITATILAFVKNKKTHSHS